MMATIKAFGPDMTCLGKKYIPHQWNIHDGEVSCNGNHSGFFSAENPLDVLTYYWNLNFDNEECWLCLIDGEIDRDGVDSKVTAQYLYPVMPLNLLQFASIAGKYIKEHPWVKHKMVYREEYKEKTMQFGRHEQLVIVRGKHPTAKAREGMVVVLLKEHPYTETITNMSVYQVDEKNYFSGTTYTIR